MTTNVGGYGWCRGRRLRYSDFFAARGYAFAMDTADLPPEDGPEAEFARRIAAGPPGSSVDAEAGLYRLLAPRVRRYGQRHLRDEHAAEDLMQHVMAMTIEQLRAGALREPGRVVSFVFGACRTVVKLKQRPQASEAQLPVA